MHVAALVISLFAGIFSFFQGGLITIVGGLGGGLGEYGGDTAFAEEAYMAGGAGMLVVLAAITGIVGGILAGMKKKYAWKVLVAASIMCVLAGFGVFSDAFIYAIFYGIAVFCSYKSTHPEFFKGKDISNILDQKQNHTSPVPAEGKANSSINPYIKGTTNIRQRFCTNCGERLEDGFTFCPNCGEKSKQIEQVHLVTEETDDSNEKGEPDNPCQQIPEIEKMEQPVFQQDLQTEPIEEVKDITTHDSDDDMKKKYSPKVYLSVGIVLCLVVGFFILQNFNAEKINTYKEYSQDSMIIARTTATNCLLRNNHNLSARKKDSLEKDEPIRVLGEWQNIDDNLQCIRDICFTCNEREYILKKGAHVKKVGIMPPCHLSVSFYLEGESFSGEIAMSDLDFKWYKVQTGSGEIGWIHSSLIDM